MTLLDIIQEPAKACPSVQVDISLHTGILVERDFVHPVYTRETRREVPAILCGEFAVAKRHALLGPS